jgi:hypothetical protein
MTTPVTSEALQFCRGGIARITPNARDGRLDRSRAYARRAGGVSRGPPCRETASLHAHTPSAMGRAGSLKVSAATRL